MAKQDGRVDDPGKVVAELQAILVDLIALSLQTKQAHWNVRGPLFKPLHELYDEMTDQVRLWYDDVAERQRALGGASDGRPSTVARGSRLDDLPAGEVSDQDSAARVLRLVESVVGRIRGGIDEMGAKDPVTQDMLIGIVEGLEKQAWMLRASVG